MLSLTNRLSLAASMVRRGSIVCDVGTDHAYLPSYLVMNDICPSALACDIGELPLWSAKKTIEKYGLSDRIQLILSDGLERVAAGSFDDLVIAGMGGDTIVHIISNAPWLKDARYRLILQPMTHSEDVRRLLFENGFSISREECIDEGQKTYLAIMAQYSGDFSERSEFEIYFGVQEISAQAEIYRLRQLKRLQSRLDGLLLSVGDNEETQTIRRILSEYKGENL